MALTKNDILQMQDIEVKEIMIPDTVPHYGGETVYLRQLSRGEQDTYLKRQYGDAKMQGLKKTEKQTVSAFNLYGHDSWLFVRGVCNADGKRIFSNSDVDAVKAKNGEFIGHVAKEILKHSRMVEDTKTAKELGESEGEGEGESELKN